MYKTTKITHQVIGLLYLLFMESTVQANDLTHTTQGTEFWLTFGANHWYVPNAPYPEQDLSLVSLRIRIVAAEDTRVTFTFQENSSSSFVDIPAGTVYTKELTENEKKAVYSYRTGTTNRSLRIQSAKPISVYAINQARSSTDASNILPVTNLGTAYYHISFIPFGSASTGDGFTLVAVENSTQIYENGTIRATLNRGQVYSSYKGPNRDATGTYVTSDKPVAYFVTNAGAYVPSNTQALDCFYQQLSPVNLWGTRFLVPVTKRGKERIRIVASMDNTVITQSGGTVISGSLNLNRGQFLELETNLASGGCYIRASKPVGVCSYLMGFDTPGLSYNIGDPSIAWIPPLQQSVNGITVAPFYPAEASPLLQEHYAVIITPTDKKNETEISIGNNPFQELTGGTWKDNTAAGYSFYSIQLTERNQAYTFINPSGLTVLGYGLGFSVSYYYLAGSAARNLNPSFYVNDIHFQDLDGQQICSQNLTISATIYSRSPNSGYLKWYLNNVQQTQRTDSTNWSMNLAPGNYTMRMEVTNAQGNLDVCTTTFTIITASASVTGPSTVCTGQFSQVTSSLSGGNWSSSNATIAAVNSTGSVIALSPGIVNFTHTSGDCIAATGPLTVYPRTVASDIHVRDTSVCKGDIVDLNSLVTASSTIPDPVFKFYTTMTGNQLTGPSVSPEVDTTYYAALEGNGYCEGFSSSGGRAAVSIMIRAKSGADYMNVKNDTICLGDSIDLHALVSAHNTVINPVFRFYTSLTGSNRVDPVVRPAQTTTYYVSLQGDNFCEGDADTSGRLPIQIMIHKCSFTVTGTVFPFVYDEEDPEFGELFTIYAALYPVPDGNTDPIDEIRNGTPLFIDTAFKYDGSVFVPGTPANPGQMGLTSNPGMPVQWSQIGKLTGNVDTTTLREGELPSSDIGIFTFHNVPAGDYILLLSRNGFMNRFAKITVTEDTWSGHREIIPGDVNEDLIIDMYDISIINTKRSVYGSPRYEPKYDINSDGRINDQDISLILFYIGFSMELYQDTFEWLQSVN